ncbi:MAG: flagellar hook basal-body protein, partial [Thermoplasmatales archaeon]
MYKGIYIALSGAVLKQKQMEVITQNLANVGTTGYKKSNISFEDYLMEEDKLDKHQDVRFMSHVSDYKFDLSSGNLVYTGNPLDIALDGDGFIALEGNLYTRRGDLRKDEDGFLTNYSGIKVLGKNGPIKLPKGTELHINESGAIYVDGVEVDSIQIADFPQKENLLRSGKETFFTPDNPIKAKAIVKEGYLETSNVD